MKKAKYYWQYAKNIIGGIFIVSMFTGILPLAMGYVFNLLFGG